MDHTMSQLAHVMHSVFQYQKATLNVLRQFCQADGVMVIEFEKELKNFYSWRTGKIDEIKDLETEAAYQWVKCSQLTPSDNPAMGERTLIHCWTLSGGHVCIAVYIKRENHSYLTAWCIILPSGVQSPDKAKLSTLVKLVQATQEVHLVSKNFSEIISHGVLSFVLGETSPWGLIAIDRTGKPQIMNACARIILARQNGIILKDGKIRLARSSADRTLQSLLNSAPEEAGQGDDRDIQVVSVPDKDGRILYAVEVRRFESSHQPMSNLQAVLVITDFDRKHGASCQALAKIFSLSNREAQLAEVFGKGYKIEETAKLMRISPHTARVHLQHVLRKTGTQSQIELAHVLSRLPSARPS